MKKTDLLVIGGSAGGILSATTARKAYGDIDITLIRDTPKVMVPCGIPYIYGTLHSTDRNVIPDTGLEEANVNLYVDKVLNIDRENRQVSTENGEVFEYKKLVIATGSLPLIPAFIPGHDLENVFAVLKNKDYLNTILEKLEAVQNVVVIGGGFIGVEFAEQMHMLGKKVTLVEMADACLWQAFDKNFSQDIEGRMKEAGIDVRTSTKVSRILGDKTVSGVEFEGGETVPAEMVILGLGVKPNAEIGRAHV